jgi:hypothetical protein
MGIVESKAPCGNVPGSWMVDLVYYIHKYSFKHYEVLDSTLYFNRRRLNDDECTRLGIRLSLGPPAVAMLDVTLVHN